MQFVLHDSVLFLGTDLILSGMAEVSRRLSSNQRYRDDSVVSCEQHPSPSDLQHHHNKSQVRNHSLFNIFFIYTRPIGSPQKLLITIFSVLSAVYL